MSKQESLFKTKVVPGKPGSGNLFDEEIVSYDGPVKCLGLEFENDEARRAHFTEELRKKLQEPEFRKIDGFPIGEDEDILRLSDPPYYTACPNPWIADFIEEWESQKPEKPADYHYHREPFAADVSEGKADPIYNAHSYHTKVPYKAIMRYFLHYTEPGDIVSDGFCGTGMAGVAAQMCGDRDIIESLGYKIENDGTIFQEDIDDNGKKIWKPVSKLGSRKTILTDLSPAATSIAYNYNAPINLVEFKSTAKRILAEIKDQCGWMYDTQHEGGTDTKGIINYVVWSEVNICPECGEDFVYYDEIRDENKKLKSTLNCPSCGAELRKGYVPPKSEGYFDERLNTACSRTKRVPVLINYTYNKKRYEKRPDSNDLKILSEIEAMPFSAHVPSDAIPDMQMMKVGRMQGSSISHLHHFFLSRARYIVGQFWEKTQNIRPKTLRSLLEFWVDSHLVNLSLRNRFRPEVSFPYNPLTGVFYLPSMSSEGNVFQAYENKLKRILKAFNNFSSHYGNIVQTGSTSSSLIPENSQDYIFTDPPFGENIYYSDLNFFVEAWYRVYTNTKTEAIIDKVKKKKLNDYQELMTKCFEEYYRILKPGRWLTVEFSNSKAAVWNVIQESLQTAGFVLGNVASLDKKQRSFQSVSSPTAVKQDLVISAYKPNGGFEDRFESEAQTEEGVWDFVRTHLKYLPVIKKQGYDLVAIPERDPRILYDQVISYYVRKGYNVPIDSQEFQLGLSQRFIPRDGMYFLPDQVAEYDRKKMIGGGRPLQQSLFISDEASAIEWLRSLLRDKPQSFQDINPLFMKEIGGWSKNEVGLELSILLEQNFLPYDGKGPVPDQIHSYLSTNWKDMRNLPKEDPALVAKAKGRWYVADPNKAGDLEKLREKALLKEFEEYKQAKKKLKIFRLEAVRVGFKKAWQERDYKIIITVAEKIPNNVLEEDPKLLMWYDQAVTRLGGE